MGAWLDCEVTMNTAVHSPAAPTRRRLVAGIAATLACAATGLRVLAQAKTPEVNEKPADPAHAALTALHYEIDFKASPARFYHAIIDAKQFLAFSGYPAEIDARPGGTFKLFSGLIEGRNIELVENQRIVQAWRPAHWDAGVYSLIRFELKPRGAEVSLAFDHTGFPAGDYDSLDWGWHNHYWDPLKKYLV
jgi:activator of HSP90 ATPase